MNQTIQFTQPFKIFGHTETMVIIGKIYSYEEVGQYIVLKKKDDPRQMRIPRIACVFCEPRDSQREQKIPAEAIEASMVKPGDPPPFYSIERSADEPRLAGVSLEPKAKKKPGPKPKAETEQA